MKSLKLINPTVVEVFYNLVKGDNRAVGLIINKVLSCTLGGKAIGEGNKQRQWISEEGIVYALGCGRDLKNIFKKSNNKGQGRSGSQLKEGEAFLQIVLENGDILIKEFSRKEVMAIVCK